MTAVDPFNRTAARGMRLAAALSGWLAIFSAAVLAVAIPLAPHLIGRAVLGLVAFGLLSIVNDLAADALHTDGADR